MIMLTPNSQSLQNRPYAQSLQNGPSASTDSVSTSTGKVISGAHTMAGQVSHITPASNSAHSLADQWQLPKGVDNAKLDAAARTITASLRKQMATTVHKKMISSGESWNYPREHGQSVTQVSSANLSALRVALSTLTTAEKKFLERFLASPLQVTHATHQDMRDATGKVGLHSRQKLLRNNIAFSQDNTSPQDIRLLGTDDYVFLSLEQSDDEAQKTTSRFGDKIMRFPFDSPAIEQQGLLMLFDPLQPGPTDPETRIPALKKLPPIQKSMTNNDLLTRFNRDADEIVFQGSHMKPGLAMAILSVCRNLPESIHEEVLENTSMNNLINGFYRPQIIVARQFFGTMTDMVDNDPQNENPFYTPTHLLKEYLDEGKVIRRKPEYSPQDAHNYIKHVTSQAQTAPPEQPWNMAYSGGGDIDSPSLDERLRPNSATLSDE